MTQGPAQSLKTVPGLTELGPAGRGRGLCWSQLCGGESSSERERERCHERRHWPLEGNIARGRR